MLVTKAADKNNKTKAK